MNGEKRNLLSGSLVVALAVVVSSTILGWSYSHAKKGDEAITVTGSAKKRIKSDLVVWSAAVTMESTSVADAYKRLSQDIPKIKDYLAAKGVPEDQMTVSSVTTTPKKRT